MKYLMLNTFLGNGKTYLCGKEYECLESEDLLNLRENVDYKFTNLKEEEKENKKVNK